MTEEAEEILDAELLEGDLEEPEDVSSEPSEKPEVSPNDYAGLRSALTKEREARERFEQETKRLRFLREHPHVTEDDLRDLPLDRWKYFAERLQPRQTVPQVSEEDIEDRAEMERFTRTSGGGSGSVPTTYDPDMGLSALEADKRYRDGDWTLGQYENWMRAKHGGQVR